MAFKRSGVRFSYAPQEKPVAKAAGFFVQQAVPPPAAQVLPLSGAGVPNSFSRKRTGLQSIDSQEILAELTQSNNAVILPNTLKISNLSCEIFVAEEGP